MSQVPRTPPEISSREDTPPESLLARLRKITGLTEAELPPPPLEEPLRTGPPVDRLMVALREATGVAAACGIAVAAALAAALLWTWERTLEGRLYARRWQQLRAARQGSRMESPDSAGTPQTPVEVAAIEVTEAIPVEPAIQTSPRDAAKMEAPAVEAPAAMEPPEDGPGAERQAVHVPGAVPNQGELRPRRMRRAVAGTALLTSGLGALLLVPAIRYQITSLLGWGNAAVIAGEGGWLFPRASAPAASGIDETAARLRAGGATLIVVSVPAKAAIYPERLHASHSGGLERDPAVAAAQQKLTADGALLFDLGPVLYALKTGGAGGEALFRAQSSHWSPRGVERAAAAVAAFVQQIPGYAALPLHPLHPSLVRYTLTDPLEDLATAYDSRRWHAAHPPEPLHFIRLLDASQQPLAPDPASPVVLIGGDEIRIYDDPTLTPSSDAPPPGGRLSAGFAQYLGIYLSASLDVHTAQSPTAAAAQWLETRSEGDRAGKKFILWVVTDREWGH
jgi:alginate O-acetyltransferase complex protein AlgJ